MGKESLPLVVVEQDMREPLFVSFAGTTAAVFSARKPGQQGGNEDAVALLTYDRDSGVAIVADGAGGQPEGGRAAALAVREMQRAVAEAARTEASLREAVKEFHRRFYHRVPTEAQLDGLLAGAVPQR